MRLNCSGCGIKERVSQGPVIGRINGEEGISVETTTMADKGRNAQGKMVRREPLERVTQK